jgi:ATP-dependent Lhr-like helicase
MELAGELTAGRFFEGIHSLQFAGPAIVEELKELETILSDTQPLYWMNAADPASPAGWNIEGLDPHLPARTSTARLCFRGKDLIAVSTKSGKELELYMESDDPDLGKVIVFISLPRTRSCHPVQKISLEKINGKTAAESPYAAAFQDAGFIADRGQLMLW